MSDLTYWVIVGLFFFVMMRWGCGAHMMGGHGGHGKHDDHKTPNKGGNTS